MFLQSALEEVKHAFQIYDSDGILALIEAYPIILNLNLRLPYDVVLESMLLVSWIVGLVCCFVGLLAC